MYTLAHTLHLRDTDSHLYDKHTPRFSTNTTLPCHITSGHMRQSNPIKFISICWGKHYQAFHAVSSACAGSLSWSQSVRVRNRKKNREEKKKTLFLREGIQMRFVCQWRISRGVEGFVRRIKKYEKKIRPALFLLNKPAPDRRICACLYMASEEKL